MSLNLVLLLAHAPTATALASAAEFILGERLARLCVADIADVQSLDREASRIVAELGIGPGDQVRIYTDLEGSTPWRVANNVASRCCAPQPTCNVQLAMVLEPLEVPHICA